MDITDKLYQEALKILPNAYAPYSKFKVAAAIYADNGKICTGCNVENISFPCGTCAEAGAISNMITNGGKRILEILIISDNNEIITPCGACLQRIAEFADNDTIITIANNKGIQKHLHLRELLPHCFQTEKLK